MKLEIGRFKIKNISPSDRTYIKNQTLFVNASELRQIIVEDSRFSKVDIEIVHPGDSVRIINVLDVIEPRVKVEGGVAFPEWIGALETAGTG